MKTIATFLLTAFLATPLFAAEPTAVELKPIFNGTDLTGWRVPNPNPFWRVENGVLIGENNESLKGHVLYTEQVYTNFVIELDARWTGEIDSGVMMREPEIQVQLGISRSLKRDMTGAFYLARHPINPNVGYPEAGHAKGVEKIFKADDWNTFRIEAKGDTFTVWLNGKQISQYTDARYSKPAPIGLQVHPGLKMKVEFRNLRTAALE